MRSNNMDILGDVFEVGAPESAAAALTKPSESQIKSANTPFLTVENGAIVSSPLGGNAMFDYAELEGSIQQCFHRSPAAPVVDTVVEAGGTATNTVTLAEVQAVNPGMTAILIPFVLVQFTAAQLTALPSGVIETTITIGTEFNANCVYQAIQIAQAKVMNRMNVTVVPFQLVQSKPRPLNGIIRQGSDLTVVSTGLATGMRVTVVIPGTTHPAIKAAIRYGRQIG